MAAENAKAPDPFELSIITQPGTKLSLSVSNTPTGEIVRNIFQRYCFDADPHKSQKVDMDLRPIVKSPIPVASHQLKDNTSSLVSLTEETSNVQPLTNPPVYTCNTSESSSLTARRVAPPSALSNTTQEPIRSQAVWDLGGDEIDEEAYESDPGSADEERNLRLSGSRQIPPVRLPSLPLIVTILIALIMNRTMNPHRHVNVDDKQLHSKRVKM